MAPPRKLTTTMPPAVGWSASAFVATVLARLIRRGLAMLPELDEAAVGHLRRLEGLLAPVWRVLDAADAGAIDFGQRPVQDLLDAAYFADDALDDLDLALLQIDMTGAGERGADTSASTPAVGAARKPRSPLRFLLCFSPPRNSVASASSDRAHSKSQRSSVDLDGLKAAFEMVAQAAYRCTSMYEHVVARKNYATMISLQKVDSSTATAQDQYDIFGREAEVEQILEKVRFGDDLHYRLGVGVLPVVGAEGVGKTALAQFIFHHKVIKAEFPVRIWVHVSGALVITKLMVRMIHEVGRDACDVEDIRELLVSELTGKRFLLVLDNVTDVGEEQWRDLMEVLEPAARRSLIVVTTHLETVASATGTMPSFILSPMAFDDYWKMFKHFAFGSVDETEDCTLLGDEWDDLEEEEEELTPMEQIVYRIAINMDCLPLPARVIGRSVYLRKDEEVHWNSVLEDKLWEQSDAGRITPALWLGYQHLDPRLKQCFAYCAVFPGDYVFGKHELEQMWVGHGLIYSDDATVRMEDVAGKYFDELVDRCFIQHIASDRYVMHNMMQKLARAVSGIRFYMITESSGAVPQEVRHLTIRTNNLLKLKRDLALPASYSSHHQHHFLRRVRTLLFLAEFSDPDEILEVLAEIFCIAENVRVLGLSSADITSVPAEIGLLKRLRYLSLSGNKITDIPETVCQLYLLQFLNIKCNSPCLRPPSDITNLIHLRHLHASELFLSDIPHIQNFSNLQSLEAFQVGNRAHIDALRRMVQLRGTLRIGNLHQVDVSEVRKGILKGMQQLKELQLSWGSCEGETKEVSTYEEVLECFQPYENLNGLRITGYRGMKSPSWMLRTSCTLLNVTSIYLVDCMNWKTLPPLYVLPSLEILVIRTMHSISKVSIVPQRSDQELFPKLKRLVFEDALHCTEWSTGNSRNIIFPCLCELEIRNCPNLTTFPDIPLSLTVMIIETAGFEKLPMLHHKQSSEEEAASTSTEIRWTSQLTTLQIHKCHRLRSLGSSLLQQQHLLRSLEVLSIKNCNNTICDLPDGFKHLTALHELTLYDCPKLLVDKFHTSLRTLEMSECFIAQGAWVDEYPFLFSVWTLKISGCFDVSPNQDSNIGPLDWLSCLFNVYNLHLENTVLVRLGMFDKLHSLEILEIDGCHGLLDDSSEFGWLEKLQTISIRNCNELCGLPENLCTLPALEELLIENCPSIEALPENGLPASLKRLSISKCSPRLTERCLDDELDRTKVANIGNVYIDGKCILA